MKTKYARGWERSGSSVNSLRKGRRAGRQGPSPEIGGAFALPEALNRQTQWWEADWFKEWERAAGH
jgi:hypothetical protein